MEVVAGPAAGVEAGGLQLGAHLAGRVGQRGEGAPVEGGPPAGGGQQAQQQAQGGGLAGPVGSGQSDDPARVEF